MALVASKVTVAAEQTYNRRYQAEGASVVETAGRVAVAVAAVPPGRGEVAVEVAVVLLHQLHLRMSLWLLRRTEEQVGGKDLRLVIYSVRSMCLTKLYGPYSVSK